jgi:hypothetical protein
MAARAKRLFSSSRALAAIEAAMFVWLGLNTLAIYVDQILMLPPRPPTPAEVAAATPGAESAWKGVYASLYRRLPRPPPELGGVWMTRGGRICGLVNTREAGVDLMTPFYTLNGAVMLREDSVPLYFRTWMDCIDSHWVILHEGTQQTGLCASVHGRATVLGREICAVRKPGGFRG